MMGVLSDTEQDVALDLTHLGLPYTSEVKKKFYYVPTLLVSGLHGRFTGAGGATKAAAAAAEGASIVETK